MARMINEFWSDPRWPFFSSSGAGTISPVIRFHRARPSSLFIFFRLCGYIRVFKKYLLFFLRCFFFFCEQVIRSMCRIINDVNGRGFIHKICRWGSGRRGGFRLQVWSMINAVGTSLTSRFKILLLWYTLQERREWREVCEWWEWKSEGVRKRWRVKGRDEFNRFVRYLSWVCSLRSCSYMSTHLSFATLKTGYVRFRLCRWCELKWMCVAFLVRVFFLSGFWLHFLIVRYVLVLDWKSEVGKRILSPRRQYVSNPFRAGIGIWLIFEPI